LGLKLSLSFINNHLKDLFVDLNFLRHFNKQQNNITHNVSCVQGQKIKYYPLFCANTKEAFINIKQERKKNKNKNVFLAC
jgi:hypothetical protein